MRVNAAFSRLLRLEGVWIRAVRFEPGRVVVEVALRRRRLVCPLCGYSTRARRDTRPVDSVWRHLDLGTWRLEIHARRRRVDCPVHGVRAEAVPFARPHCGFTRDFEALVAWLATRTDKTTVKRLVRVDWGTVGRIIERVCVEEIDPDRISDLYEIGVDEVSWRKQHRYLTLVVDHQRRRVVWGTAGAGAAAADTFFAELDPDQAPVPLAPQPAEPAEIGAQPPESQHAAPEPVGPRPRVGERAARLKAISLDMGAGYAKSAREHAPQAVICIDPFHVVALANKALDAVRREYWNEPRQVGDQQAAKRFKDARWALLKSPVNLTEKQAATHRQLKAAGGKPWRGYTLKEALRGIFSAGLTIDDVTVLLDRFLSRAARSRLEPFVRLGQTIKKHRDGILAAIRLGITQGRTEALNNKVRLITRRAYGFHSAQAALALVLLTCGPIDLQPPHEHHSP
ncbi:MAG: transposase [Solirubrobacteraceae bacterium]